MGRFARVTVQEASLIASDMKVFMLVILSTQDPLNHPNPNFAQGYTPNTTFHWGTTWPQSAPLGDTQDPLGYIIYIHTYIHTYIYIYIHRYI